MQKAVLLIFVLIIIKNDLIEFRLSCLVRMTVEITVNKPLRG